MNMEMLKSNNNGSVVCYSHQKTKDGVNKPIKTLQDIFECFQSGEYLGQNVT